MCIKPTNKTNVTIESKILCKVSWSVSLCIILNVLTILNLASIYSTSSV